MKLFYTSQNPKVKKRDADKIFIGYSYMKYEFKWPLLSSTLKIFISTNDQNQNSTIQNKSPSIVKSEICEVKDYENHFSAGLWPRLQAGNIDLTIQLPFYYLISHFTTNHFATYLLCMLFSYTYESTFQYSQWQGTPGKFMMKIKIVYSGSSISLLPFYRTLIKFISVLILPAHFAFIALHPKHKSLHDLATGSSVIFISKKWIFDHYTHP